MTVLTLQPDASTSADTPIDATNPTLNYGTSAFLTSGSVNPASQIFRSLLKFDLSSIPSNATINSAILTLVCTSESGTADRTVGAHRALTQWYPGVSFGAVPGAGVDASTWNLRNTNGAVAWGAVGGLSATDFAATATASVLITAPGTFTWDLTTDVAAMVLGTYTNFGWWLKNVSEATVNSRKVFASSDNTTAADRPKLVVIYNASGTITITTPVRYKTFQRSSSIGSIAITGSYTGTPTAIEASFNGGAYSTIVASPAGGTYSGTLSSQAAGQGTLAVRFTNDTAINTSTSDIGIGDVFIVAGQSNAVGAGDNAQNYSHATLKATVFRQDDAWKNGNDPTDVDTGNGSVWPLVATLLMATTGYPVAFITTGKTSTALVGGTWTKNGAEYADCVQTTVNSGVNSVRAVLWRQGESDAGNSVSANNYATALSTFLNDLQADTGFATMPLVCAVNGYQTTVSVTRSMVDNVRLGQLQAIANDADILPGPLLYDIGPLSDGVHTKTDAELLKDAQRWWRCIYNAFFSGSESARGPQFVSATRLVNVITVTFTGGQGNLTGQADTTGWRVTDNGTPITVNSTAANGSTKVDLTLSSTPSGTVLVSFGSFNDGTGSTLKDSGTYPLPPEPIVAQTVTLASSGGGESTRRKKQVSAVWFAQFLRR